MVIEQARFKGLPAALFLKQKPGQQIPHSGVQSEPTVTTDYFDVLVSYGVLSGKPVTLNPAMTIFKDIRIRGFWLSKWFETAAMEEKQAAFGQIIPLIASGALRANVDSRFTVSEIKQAVTRAAQGGRNGKVLIVPNAD